MMNNETVDRGNLHSVLGEVLGSVPITDIHTHIYPAEFKQLSLWGIDELLTYHYLVAEFFRFSDMPYDDFFALPKERQAELVWTTLFIDKSPVSEAARGVLTILSRLGLDVASRDLQSYRAYFASLDHKDYIGKVLDISGVSEIVMTNDPFDPVEHEFWTTIGNPDPRFKGVLRLDPLLNDYGNSWRKLVEWGYAVEATMNAGSVAEITRLCVPSDSAVAGVNVQVPPAVTTAVPISVPPSVMWMVVPASPVPLRVGLLSLVVPPAPICPVTGPTSSSTPVTTGLAGGVASTVMAKAGVVVEVLPALSLA